MSGQPSQALDLYPFAAEVVRLEDCERIQHSEGAATGVLRARSFTIAWSQVEAEGVTLDATSESEYLVLLPDLGATLVCGAYAVDAPGRSVCVMPEGSSSVRLRGEGQCLRIFGAPPAEYAAVPVYSPLAQEPFGPPLRLVRGYRRVSADAIPIVHRLDALSNSPGMPRAKLFQSATLSINWVDYNGARDRQALSPHSHADIEQASIAIGGRFVHHFRTTWGPDADRWRPDDHISAGERTIALIPPPVIHTSEGVCDTRHILIDVFSPPREDFIARGQVLNSRSYHPLDH